jgi:P27 family predicted phage terminase small subunit
MRGRKPKPSVLKKLHHSQYPINEREPIPEGELSVESDSSPAHFDAEQRAVWNDALGQSPPGMLKLIDASVFEAWVVAHCLHRKIVKELAVRGLTVITQNGTEVQSPFLGMLNRQAQIMMRAAGELGFTPTARPRIGLTMGGEELGSKPYVPSPDEETLEEYLRRAPNTKAVN